MFTLPRRSLFLLSCALALIPRGALVAQSKATAARDLVSIATPAARQQLSVADRYKVVFASRPASLFESGSEKSSFGHTFIVLRREDETGNAVVERAIGWAPASHILPAINFVLSGELPSGPGRLVDDAATMRYAARLLSVEASSAEVRRVIDSIRRFPVAENDGPAGTYVLTAKDCVDLVIAVAKELGLKVPERGLGNVFPDDYMKELIDANRPEAPPQDVRTEGASLGSDELEVVKQLALVEANPESWTDLYFTVHADGRVTMDGTKTYTDALRMHGDRGNAACARVRTSGSTNIANAGDLLDRILSTASSAFNAVNASPAYASPLVANPAFWRAASGDLDVCISSWLGDPLTGTEFRGGDYEGVSLLIRTTQPRSKPSPLPVPKIKSGEPDWSRLDDFGESGLIAIKLAAVVEDARKQFMAKEATTGMSPAVAEALRSDSARRFAIQRTVRAGKATRTELQNELKAWTANSSRLHQQMTTRNKIQNAFWNAHTVSRSQVAAAQMSAAISQMSGSIDDVAGALGAGIGSGELEMPGSGSGGITAGATGSKGGDGAAASSTGSAAANGGRGSAIVGDGWTVNLRSQSDGRRTSPVIWTPLRPEDKP